MRIVKIPDGSIDRFTRAIVMTIPFDLELAVVVVTPTRPSGIVFTGDSEDETFTGSA